MSKVVSKEHSVNVSNKTSAIIAPPDSKNKNANVCNESHRNSNVDKERTISLKDQEHKLRLEFQDTLRKEVEELKDNFELVLQNEQIRTAFMLREAQREKEEKVYSLRAQLECKNMAGLMYVLCMERRQNQLEQARIIEDYTTYINYLQSILSDGQDLILYLSREYKSAARVDDEWREKMKKVIYEFQRFIRDFSNGTMQDVQHLFDLPELLNVKASKNQDPEEDPCDEEPSIQEIEQQKQQLHWYETIDCGPFIVYGDMADFNPDLRREVLRKIKAKKTAPRKWKEYVFNDMPLKRQCYNLNEIKNEYPKNDTYKLDNQGVQTGNASNQSSQYLNHRCTSTSVDGNNQMSSILKLMTSSSQYRTSDTKALILGAKDSLEIASSTRLLKIKRNGGSNKNSINANIIKEKKNSTDGGPSSVGITAPTTIKLKCDDEHDILKRSKSLLGSVVNDSIQIMHHHVPDKDATIVYNKICPVDKCNNLKVSTFMKSLPPYMTAGPYKHYEQTFEEYEPCSPEQLKYIRELLEKSKKQDDVSNDVLLEDWSEEIGGISCQTSFADRSQCKCLLKGMISEEPSEIVQYHVEDLVPIKKTIDHIKKECLFDERIQFDRFKLIGEEHCNCNKDVNNSQFKNRLVGVKEILTQHPSICSMFQANT